MTAFLLLLTPLAPPAETSRPGGVIFVDVIIVNQFTELSECDGRKTHRTLWFDSFLRIHWFPAWGTCRVAVWQHCGWRVSERLVPCADGFAAASGVRCVIAPAVLHVVTDFDVEYNNRQWYTEPAPRPLP